MIRPAVLGASRVAVVLPTYSWQAYNFYDSDQDGRPDSWYADSHRHNVLLGRPYAGSGKPPHYRTQQRGFLRFLVHTGKRVDYLTDEDLERIASGDDLARLYDLIIFSGHEEYATTHAYDLTQRYRDLGGNLAFLSADNFFWRVDAAVTGSGASSSGGISAARKHNSSASSTAATTEVVMSPRTSSRMPRPRHGSSAALVPWADTASITARGCR